eukprot:CAMPEP_0181173098 /NCGR_PEP_ID=MMETSP1096-20121128/2808_1 /TAXON_ID=156174 ORGANISM="Chrysochromulina ericina, Strain CCMP281" /NCGR_SAMPLE_ID=MMETSP1096 /ASSEMBLY_ACC=CAM_ASM_000453 /LENGTH=254 /DNA_ID=CAMNT_0023260883 /DNA_START=675 /DNA_END=1437 /DNA_ORIENTATION=-
MKPSMLEIVDEEGCIGRWSVQPAALAPLLAPIVASHVVNPATHVDILHHARCECQPIPRGGVLKLLPLQALAVGPRADSTHASTTRLWATKRISLAERRYPAPVAYGNGNTAPSVSHAGKKPFVPGVPKVLPKLESAACKFQPNAQRSARTPVRNAAGTMPAKLMAPTRANLRHRRELRRGSQRPTLGAVSSSILRHVWQHGRRMLEECELLEGWHPAAQLGEIGIFGRPCEQHGRLRCIQEEQIPLRARFIYK